LQPKRPARNPREPKPCEPAALQLNTQRPSSATRWPTKMRFGSPIFRKYLWCAFLPAAITLLLLDLALPGGSAQLQLRILGALAFAVALSFLAALWGSHSLIRRLSALRDCAQNLIHSHPSAPALPAAEEDEIGALGKALSQAAARWQQLSAQLRFEAAQREAILKSMAEGVLAVDKELRVTFCNDSLARLLGVQPPFSSRLSLLDLARDPGLTEVLAQALNSRKPSRRTLQLAAAHGRIFEVNAAPLTAASREGAIAILHDITELERLERVRKDFVANVSHELRTPLTAIRGYAETLLDGAVDDPKAQRRFLSVILAHTLRLNNIASDLLVLSDLDSGRSQPEPERISVRSAVETAIHTVEPEAQLRSVRLIPGNLEPAHVSGTKMRLEQALINLLDNAVKFNHAGGSVRVDSGRIDAGHIYISICDSGIGIPSEDLSRIFERFYRVDRARSREVGGTGLGLSIVKHVVERMNGAVKVESRLGEGSTFTIVLPSCPSPG
jgi:two-component system phosphate regulon sensor histidine kinase PhoR